MISINRCKLEMLGYVVLWLGCFFYFNVLQKMCLFPQNAEQSDNRVP